MPSDDLSNIEGDRDRRVSPSGKSAAALEADLQAANKVISKHNAERVLFFLVLVVIWDAHTFKSSQGWAPPIGLLAFELIGSFVLAYRFDLHEVIQLFWGAMRSYGRQEVGPAPAEE